MGRNFAENFAEGLPQGIALSRELKTRGKERTTQKAMEILGQVERLDPNTGVFSESQQGVPEPGQAAAPSGVGLTDLNRQYFDVIGGFQDLESYAAAKKLWGATQMSKVNEYGMGAVAAYDRGDMEGAKRLMTAATAFASPNTSSEVQIDPKTGAFVIANYDSKGNPVGGMALKRDDIIDFVNLNNDPQAWANAEDVNIRHGKELGLRYDMFRETKRANAAQEARLQGSDEREALESQARLVNLALDRELKLLDVKGKDKEQADALISEAHNKLASMMTYNITDAEESKAEYAANMDLVRYIQQSTQGEAASYDALFDNAQSKASSPYAGMDITKMTLGQLREFGRNYGNWVAGQTKEGDFSTPLGRYQIVGDTRDDAQRGLRLPDSTVFTPEIQDRMAVWVYQNQGPEAWVAWNDKNVPPPAAGAASAGAIPDPNDPLSMLMADDDSDKKRQEDKLGYLPWFFEEPNAEGERKMRGNIETSMDLLIRDLHKLNPDASASQLANMAFSAFGPKDEVDIVIGEKGEPSYVKDGVSALEVSPQIVDLIDAFNLANAKARELYDAKRNPEAYQAYNHTDPAIPDGSPAPEVGGAAAAAAPGVGGAAAAAAPGEAAAPAVGVPEPAPQATVDDTAVATTPAIPQGAPAPGIELPRAVSMNPEVAEAAQAWVAAGRPQEGPEWDALAEIVAALPMQERQEIAAELRQMIPARTYEPNVDMGIIPEPGDPRLRGRIESGGLSAGGL